MLLGYPLADIEVLLALGGGVVVPLAEFSFSRLGMDGITPVAAAAAESDKCGGYTFDG